MSQCPAASHCSSLCQYLLSLVHYWQFHPASFPVPAMLFLLSIPPSAHQHSATSPTPTCSSAGGVFSLITMVPTTSERCSMGLCSVGFAAWPGIDPHCIGIFVFLLIEQWVCVGGSMEPAAVAGVATIAPLCPTSSQVAACPAPASCLLSIHSYYLLRTCRDSRRQAKGITNTLWACSLTVHCCSPSCHHSATWGVTTWCVV